ncbi:MAG: hypothetical protein V7629_11635 [Motiliproteus sp.]
MTWQAVQDVLNDRDALIQRLDQLALALLQQDLNNDGVIDRQDISSFSPLSHKQHTRINYDALLPDNDPDTMTLVEMIHAGYSAQQVAEVWRVRRYQRLPLSPRTTVMRPLRRSPGAMAVSSVIAPLIPA